MEKELQELGLSKNESIAYICLSEIGLSSAYKVSKESGLFKSNTYDALERLALRNLVSKRTVDGKFLYEALDPSFLLDMLDEKKETANNLIPQIRLKQSMVDSDSQVTIYTGSNALRSVFYHFLEFEEPFLTYGIPKIAFEVVRSWIGAFHNERIKKNIKMKHIYNFEAHERISQIKNMPLTPVRYLPDLYDSQVTTNICGDEVVLISFRPKIKIIQIKDKDMADSYKKYFTILWSKAKVIN